MSGRPANVFLAPCDPGRFDRTVREPIDLGDFPDHPEALAGTGPVRLWGVEDTSTNRATFERMAPGDLVLFYAGDTYLGVGRIGIAVEDELEWAGEALWDGEEATLLFTVEAFTPVEVPKAAVNRIFGYGAGYAPGFMRVADDRIENSPAAIKLAVERFGA